MDLDLLTDAGAFLRPAVAAAGGRLVAWQARHVDHQPGGGVTVGYHARVRWPGGVREERLGACTGRIPSGAFVLEDGDARVAVWRFPYDPDLPGLPAAFDPASVGAFLSSLGLDGPPALRVRAYRPRRRAVIEAVGPRGRVFLKVVRPRKVAALHERHRMLVGAGVPVPHSLGYTPDGVVALQALPGRSLRDALRRGERRLPPGAALLDLLDRLPAALADLPARSSWRDRVEHYAAVVAAALPAQAGLARRLGSEIYAESAVGPTVPVHGDFYEAQVRVHNGQLTGLLDVDTAGPGDRMDDLACLLGHLSVLAQIDRHRAPAINGLGARYLAAFERTVDAVALRTRVAAVVMSLATGPHRVQEPNWPAATAQRLRLAEEWLASARALRGRSVAVAASAPSVPAARVPPVAAGHVPAPS
jgi:hypothetical protein